MHANPSPETHANRHAVRVLVVEDNVDAALTLADLLTLWGYDVRVVHDGLAALEVAPVYRPEAVLLDIGLPKMDGYGVARWLRAQPRLAGVLIVGVTGYGQDRDRQLSREAGFDHHLVKPVDLGLLRRLLEEAGQEPEPAS
jgi:two-component system, sensor histidine kinase